MSAATAKVIDLSAYRRRRTEMQPAAAAMAAPVVLPLAWMPVVLVPVVLVPTA